MAGNSGKKENIKVLVRVRPLLEREYDSHNVSQVTDEDTCIKIETEEHNVCARFDKVLACDTTQEQVYENVKFAAESVVEGFNSTIFAYGQTGSGKSYTMFGPESDLGIYDADPNGASKGAGVIPRCIREILEKATELETESIQKGEREEVSIFCSFSQIYNDQVYDLLRDPNRVQPLKVQENTRTKEIYVIGLSEYVVTSLQDCLALLEQGDEQRACRQTSMNDVSSRSHSIFQVVVERRKVDSGKVIRSKMNLVDLAGSEKWGLTDQLEQGHVSELTNINTSLHCLGRCIAALSDPDSVHVPFRDSKLTRILMDALGGNSRTCVIATLSPSEKYIEETISTLKFADRAKRVMTHAKVVETREVSLELVERLEREIKHLRNILATAGINEADFGEISEQQDEENNASDLPPSKFLDLEKQLFQANERIVQLEKRNNLLSSQGGGTIHGTSNAQARRSESNDGNSNTNDNNATHAPPSQLLSQIQSENSKLKSVLENIKLTSSKFFNFEIEEEEFQEQFQRCWSVASHLVKPKNDGGGGGGGGGMKKPPFILNNRTTGKGTTKAPFRVRGRTEEESSDWIRAPTQESKAKSLSLSLKEKQKELAKHKRLQQYLAQKAQRELERIECERQRESEMKKAKEQRNKQFQKHASIVKRRLLKMKDEEKKYCEQEQLLFEEEEQQHEEQKFPKIHHRPESRSSLLDSDVRPLSRQTIFEDEEGTFLTS